MVISILTFLMILVNAVCLSLMFYHAYLDKTTIISLSEKIRLGISGFFAFIADTVGIGSFACNIFFAKLFNTFPDEQLPAMNNGAQVLPGLLEAVFFLKIIHVEWVTLVTLIGGACIGGILGGMFMCHMNKQAIRLSMMIAFSMIIILLACHQFALLPLGGDASMLRDGKLLIGFIGMIVCGALTSAGVGLFVMVQALLFVLNISPLVAFPIMTAAGALQQPMTTLIFLNNKKIPLRKTLILSLTGCLGVLVTIPFFTSLKASWLHALLLALLFVNLMSISRNFFRHMLRNQVELTPSAFN